MKRFFLIVLIIVFGAGLLFIVEKDISRTRQITEGISNGSTSTSTTQPTPASQSFELSQDWQTLSEGIEIKSLLYEYNGQSYQIQVVRMDPKQVTVALQYDQKGQTTSQWAKDKPNTIVSNAGFFKENNEPVGLLYIHGERIDAHRVNPTNTGLLLLNKTGIEILNLANTSIPEESKLQNAVQAYPVLIDQGKVIASKSLTKQDRRTAIGTDKEKNMYLITADYPHLGLYDFAKTLNESGLQLTEVLNLDGGGSTGVSIHLGDHQSLIDSETVVPTVLVFSKKE